MPQDYPHWPLTVREWLNGEELSGGQWQRIALARAFLREAGLLVLDEPTANPDPRAEYRIFQRLWDLARERVVLPVTHHITNVAGADRIVVLDDRRILQDGTCRELAGQPGLFQQLLSHQVSSASDGETQRTRARTDTEVMTCPSVALKSARP